MTRREKSPLWWAYKAERARKEADKAEEYALECERRYYEEKARFDREFDDAFERDYGKRPNGTKAIA